MPDTTPDDEGRFDEGRFDEGRFDEAPYDGVGSDDGATIYLSMAPQEPVVSRPRTPWLLTVLVSALIGAATAATVIAVWDDDSPPTTMATAVTTVTTTALATTSPEDPAGAVSPADVAAQVLPSIVTVEVSAIAGEEFITDATGSGVVVSADGLIVTNEHVVAGAAAARVMFLDGRTYPATIVGTDALTDLAVIRIAATGLTPISFGSSTSMRVGDVAIAIGSPLGLEGGPSVTVGVLSAFGRTVRTSSQRELFGMLQTDAPITRGSSGGALVDHLGNLIGITSAIAVSDVGAEGLGFAIPVEMVRRIIADLIEDGVATHAFLGITGTTYFETRADGAVAPAGVEVVSIVEGTAAAAAGLQVGDTIVGFDDEDILTMERLVVRLRLYRVGDVIGLRITRDGVPLTLEVDLMQRPEDV